MVEEVMVVMAVVMVVVVETKVVTVNAWQRRWLQAG